MKKKTLLKFIVVAGCMFSACYFFVQNKTVTLNSLAFENIEALAYNEGDEEADCFGYGSVPCRSYYVEFKITGLSLEE